MLTIVTALPWEAGRFVERLEAPQRRDYGEGWVLEGQRDGRCVRVFVSGPGPERAAEAAGELESLEPKPNAVVSTGVAGALSDDLQVGTMVLAHDFLSAQLGADGFAKGHGERLTADVELSAWVRAAIDTAELYVEEGTSVTFDKVLGTAGLKRRERARSESLVVQMEDSVWSEACLGLGLPFASARAVLDTVATPLPEEILQWDWRGASRREVAGFLGRGPWRAGRLAQLGWHRGRACRAIDRMLESMVSAGPYGPGGATAE